MQFLRGEGSDIEEEIFELYEGIEATKNKAFCEIFFLSFILDTQNFHKDSVSQRMWIKIEEGSIYTGRNEIMQN